MQFTTNCPLCEAEGSLEVLVDAYVVYTFKGFEDNGYPAEETYQYEPIRTDQFDNVEIRCSECGEEVSWTDFEKDADALTARDSHLVIKFGENAGGLLRNAVERLYFVTVEIEYNNDVNPDFPTTAVILRGSNEIIDVRAATEDGSPDPTKQTYGVSYADIKSITII